MKTITIDTAALATIVQELAAEDIGGVGTIFMNGRADGVSSLHRRLLQLARTPAPMTSLAGHEDVIGPVAWHHQLPAGQQFLDGRSSRVVEGLQEALGHKDRFGGVLAPLFKLASVGNSETWTAEAGAAVMPAPGPTLDQVVDVLEGALVDDVRPFHSSEWVARAAAIIAAHKGSAGAAAAPPPPAGDSPRKATMGEAFKAVGGWMNGGELGYPSFGSMNALWAYTVKMIRSYEANKAVRAQALDDSVASAAEGA